ncbi:hypothetical protein BDF21DRAFT_235791 [Thamnidium elegans]|nr:hypothetical protein BDF21DRAFT_235791 [Thamnidium elegans]
MPVMMYSSVIFIAFVVAPNAKSLNAIIKHCSNIYMLLAFLLLPLGFRFFKAAVTLGFRTLIFIIPLVEIAPSIVVALTDFWFNNNSSFSFY